MKLSIQNLWAVAITDIKGKTMIHPQLFTSKEEAEKCGKNYSTNYIVSEMFLRQ